MDDVVAFGLGKTGHTRTRQAGIRLVEDLHAGLQLRKLRSQYPLQNMYGVVRRTVVHENEFTVIPSLGEQ